MSAKIELQNNNIDLQELLDLASSLPVSTFQEKIVTPKLEEQHIVADEAFTALKSVTVKGDKNFLAENIASGITIWGVSGKFEGRNFTVVGGTEQPANPIENTIWVNTDTEIVEWTIISEHEIPTNPVEGMVYITYVGTSAGRFSVFKDNGLWLCVKEAKQYISGEWDAKALSIYKNGEWIQMFSAFINVTYTAGTKCFCTNGGVTLIAGDTSGNYTFEVPCAGNWTLSATMNNGAMGPGKTVTVTADGESLDVIYELMILETSKSCGVTTTQNVIEQAPTRTVTLASVDLTGYNTLYVTISDFTDTWYARGSTTINIGSAASASVSGTGTYVFDVSNINGTVSIQLYAKCWSATGDSSTKSMTASKVWAI